MTKAQPCYESMGFYLTGYFVGDWKVGDAQSAAPCRRG